MKIPCNRPVPHEPGIYIYKDAGGEIIYIGKAKDLKKRVSSYFAKKKHWDKVAALVKKIASVDFVITDSEEEAIMLESNMIKEHYPKYNVNLRDNAPMTYALITNEEFPRLLIVRKDRNGRVRGPEGKAYGPFLSGSGKGLVSGVLRKAFKIRTCGCPMPKKLCLQYHLGNCDGPCEGKISREKYMEGIKRVSGILSNHENIGKYLDEMEGEMKKESANLNFEKAIRIRNAWRALSGLSGKVKVDEIADRDEDYIVILQEGGHARAQAWKMVHGVIRNRQKYEFDYVLEDAVGAFLRRFYEKNRIPKNIYLNSMPEDKEALEFHLSRIRGGPVHLNKYPSQGNRAELGALIEKNILLEKAGGADLSLVRLQRELKLAKIPYVIECFDVSNLGEKDVVASMVRFVNAQPRKSDYRKFRIRTVLGQDDFASMKEVVFRRYRRLLDEGEPLPDMVLVDGGLGQLHAAKNALEQLDVEIPLFSLAKKEELIFGADLLLPLRLAKNNEALQVLQRARDEAHRFAISYNRKLRGRRGLGKG
ncbi:MAG: excinuclease ABC subunit UvrC [Candidatus Micrarchaeota archaeon]